MDFQTRKEFTIILENEDDVGMMKYIMQDYLKRNSSFDDDEELCNFAQEIIDELA